MRMEARGRALEKAETKGGRGIEREHSARTRRGALSLSRGKAGSLRTCITARAHVFAGKCRRRRRRRGRLAVRDGVSLTVGLRQEGGGPGSIESREACSSCWSLRVERRLQRAGYVRSTYTSSAAPRARGYMAALAHGASSRSPARVFPFCERAARRGHITARTAGDRGDDERSHT